MEKPSLTNKIIYHPPTTRGPKVLLSSISPLGIDSEALSDGSLAMVCVSDGTIWNSDNWLEGILSFKYRGCVFVAYNLRYDAGHFVRHLLPLSLDELRRRGKVSENGITYKVVANKMLSISRHKQTVTIYDLKQYYEGSLETNAQKYLGEGKDELDTKTFSQQFMVDNWDRIARYCVRDADLVRRLAVRLIEQLNTWGLHVSKLYSTAWISYHWFASRSGHPTVGHFWKYDRRVLDFAMQSYHGGKFEVTTKGSGYLYEYDLVSAYPSTISKLVDTRHVVVYWQTNVIPDAAYAFLDCSVYIPPNLPSPIARKVGQLNTFPAGWFRQVITYPEYRYIVDHGGSATIHQGCWLVPQQVRYPYHDDIHHLVKLKQDNKGKDDMAYHTAKILMNSLYGKFIQLIEQPPDKWRAGSSWNPIYASYITAETRIKVSDLQRRYPSIWAVHTDSVISDKPLPFGKTNTLGHLSYEIEGQGIIAGCGVYEIGDKTALRGVPSNVKLRELCERGRGKVTINVRQPLSWRLAAVRHRDESEINRWLDANKDLRPNSDRKRIWLDDYKDWRELLERPAISVPITEA
jgi:hypothetical protein